MKTQPYQVIHPLSYLSWYLRSIMSYSIHSSPITRSLPSKTHRFTLVGIRLFSFVWVFRPTCEFFTHMLKWPLPVKKLQFWTHAQPCSHWAVRGFFSMPHLLWHGSSIYNGHLQGPMTLTPDAESLAVEFSLPVLNLSMPWLRFEHPTFRSYQMRHRSGARNKEASNAWIRRTRTFKRKWFCENWCDLHVFMCYSNKRSEP